MMKVKLIDCTKNGIDKIARMGRSTKLNDLPEKWDDKWGTREKFVKSLMMVGHLGILEHITFTFHVSGISRNLTHQLVRHRIASYLQQSNRKVIPKMQDYMAPPSVEDGIVQGKFNEAMVDAWSNYHEAIDSGIPIEDARYLLPSGYFTHIAITMNARQLLHFFELRCHKSAQWEIREMADMMLRICHKEYPVVFENLMMKDVTIPDSVKDVVNVKYLGIRISADGKTVWINNEEKCLFRAQEIKQIEIDDERKK